jgi:hypothetical protein
MNLNRLLEDGGPFPHGGGNIFLALYAGPNAGNGSARDNSITPVTRPHDEERINRHSRRQGQNKRTGGELRLAPKHRDDGQGDVADRAIALDGNDFTLAQRV